MTKIEGKAKVLTAESRPYNVNGNTGVSHRIRVNVEGEIFECKSSPEQVTSFQQYVGKEGTVVLGLESRKENLTMQVLEFEVDE